MNCINCTKLRSVCSGKTSSGDLCSAERDGALSAFDWLSDIKMPKGKSVFNYAELRFKNGRKAFFVNENNLDIQIGDTLAVEASSGHDIGVVALIGETARLQMLKKGISQNSEEIKKIYRKATQKDIDTWQIAISREKQALIITREICTKLNLKLKLCDVEFQADNLKAVFFYTAEGRVDFRQLIKELASTFSIRVEMRQIGLRQEAARVGGIGSCGRELCCTTWITDFRSVNTSAARYQRLSLNPQKLAGQCGKLKCCLNYELDVYIDALSHFPSSETALFTEKGKAIFQKMDVFKSTYWYSYDGDYSTPWQSLHIDDVKKIIDINKSGKRPESLEAFIENSTSSNKEKNKPEQPEAKIELTAPEEEAINRFDKKNNPNRNNRHKRKKISKQ